MTRKNLNALFLAATILSSPLLAQTEEQAPPYHATYGASSGGVFDGPMAQFSGLLIELVRADTGAPALRLFGGIPQSPAVILVGDGRVRLPENGAERLVGPVLLELAGYFDAWGYFEVPLASMPALGTGLLYAQGVRPTLLGFEYSNGIEFGDRSHAPPTAAPLSATQRDVVWTNLHQQELTEMLRQALNSRGDSITLGLACEVSTNAMIPGLDINVSSELEAEIERTEEDTYEVSIAREVALAAGAEVPGTEVSVTGGGGVARRIVYRFYSPDGIAHGLIGIALQQMLGGIRLPEIDRTMLLDAEAIYARDRQRLLDAQANLQNLRVRLQADWSRYVQETRWWVRPVLLAQYLATQAVVAVAEVGVSIALEAQAVAHALLEAARQHFAPLFAGLETARNLLWKATQVFTFANQHMVGSELRFFAAAEVEVELSIPPVSMPNILGVGFAASLERSFAVYRQFATAATPEQITVVVRQQTQLTAQGSLGLPGVHTGLGAVADLFGQNQLFTEQLAELLANGGQAELVRYTEFEAKFDVYPASLLVLPNGEATVEFGVEVKAVHLQGLGIATTNGAGAACSLTLDLAPLLQAAQNGAGLGEILALIPGLQGTLAAQVCTTSGAVAGIGIDLEVIGVELELSTEWTDQGPSHEMAVSLGNGPLRQLIFGAQAP